MKQTKVSKYWLTFQRELPQDVQHGQKVSSLEQALQYQMQLWLLKPGKEQNMDGQDQSQHIMATDNRVSYYGTEQKFGIKKHLVNFISKQSLLIKKF